MSRLTIVSLIVGMSAVAVFLPALLVPDSARKWCRAFPRHVAIGRILTAVTLAWAEALLYFSPMISGVKLADIPMLSRMQWAHTVSAQTVSLILAIVALCLIVFLLDELLAARALGGLLVLIPRQILDAAFVHDSQWKLAMTLLAYAMVVAGIVLILSPFRFRQAADFLLRTDGRSRLTGAIGVAGGIAIIILAITVY